MAGLTLGDARRLVRSGAGLQSTDALFPDTVLDDFINEAASIAEAEVRPPWRQVVATIDVAAGVVPVPADWAETKQVFDADVELHEVSITDLLSWPVTATAGKASYWCQESAAQIGFRPVPTDDTPMTVVYYRVPPTLVNGPDVTLMPRDLAISVVVPKACELVHLRQGDRVMADAKATAYMTTLPRLRRRARGSTRPGRIRIRPGGWI